MPPPLRPKIYHIVHVDRLASIAGDGCLWSDAMLVAKQTAGTTIGMSGIKWRRLHKLELSSHPGLNVGQCVPFYFCPRSIILYLIHRANHEELSYIDGQEAIIHLESDLRMAVAWADDANQRWAFTASNAGAYYFEDWCDLKHLDEINWDAVSATQWSGALKEGKQPEFLVEGFFPWQLVERIGVHSRGGGQQVASAIRGAMHRPKVEICPHWYY
jgi:ssDNA thymidine ADP-ribosyltransferase, DarT